MLNRNYDSSRHRPPAIQFTDEYGRQCLKVPLDPRGTYYALVEEAAYRRIREAGATGAWLMNQNGKGRAYVRTSVPTGVSRDTVTQVARLITGAGPRTVVRYVNGDTLDLRDFNLSWQRGKAKRTDTMLASTGKAFRAARATV